MFDWASEEFTNPDQLSKPSKPLSKEKNQIRDVLTRYIVAARGQLLNRPIPEPGGEIVAAIDVLQEESARQHRKNMDLYDQLCDRVAQGESPRVKASPDASADLKWVEQMVKQSCRKLETSGNADFCHHCRAPVNKEVSQGHHLGQVSFCYYSVFLRLQCIYLTFVFVGCCLHALLYILLPLLSSQNV